MGKVARPPVVVAALASTVAVWWLMGAGAPHLRAQSDPSVTGEWSAVQTWPDISVHASLLPTGKVIFYPYTDNPRLWDPSTGSIVAAAQAGFNIFCTGLTLLADGRLFVGGGHISNNVGLNHASVYDPETNTWTRQPDMNAGRWYPTTTTLADGSVLIVSGDVDTTVGVNVLPQVWTNGTWRDLTTAQVSMKLYPFMLLAPDGRVFNAGPQQTSRFLNIGGTGTWKSSASSHGGFRSYGTAVMYEPGKVLMVGGNNPPVASAEKIDLNLASPTWQPAGLMNSARRQVNSTVLPDGTVLITGGSSGAGFDNAAAPVLPAELWDPAQDAFTELASMTQYRGYHSIALLLPDGRVLSSGGDNHPNAELFSPPYLFKGSRPVVTSTPSSIAYGESFSVETPSPAAITAVTLVRLSAVTHAFNMNQRFLRLAFSQTPGGLSVTAPSTGRIAPPGHYMLFLLNAAGVPSIAPIVHLSATSAPAAPAAPTGLSATAVSSSQINLAWTDNASNESGVRIERSADGTTFTQIGAVSPNVTTYTDSASLSPATQYWYRVYAYNATGSSAFAGPASATTASAPTAPAAPTGLSATAVSSSQINLAWTDNASSESGFRIERSTDGTTFTQIGAVASNVTTYADHASLSPATEYWYRVYAYNGVGSSAFAGPASATTMSVPPAAPTGLSATAVSSSQINLAWTDNASNESGFRIERSADGTTFTQIGAVTSNVTTYADSASLSPATQYWYRVYAYNGVGASAFAGPASATTASVPAAPAAPTGLSATAVSSSQINLAWTDNASNESGFRIERSADGTTFTQIGAVTSNVTTYADSASLSPATRYWYRVYAYNGVGSSAFAGPASATTASVPTAPAAPTGLSATAVSSSQINLAWTDNASNESGFRIERSADGTTFTQIGAVTSNVTTYADSASLSPGTQYWYRVYAYNGVGASAFAGPASATTMSVPPAAPTGLTATAVSSSQINLAWTDNASNESGFRIERSADGTTFTQIGAVTSNVTTYADSASLSPGTQYWYRVYAYNGVGASAFAGPASATTMSVPPAAPTGLSATAVSSSQINLAWTDNASNESGFRIERSADGTTFTQIGAVTSNVTTYADSASLSPGTQYWYRVYAYNGVGSSAFAGPASATTLPPPLPSPPSAPTGLVAARQSGQMTLTWTDTSNNETGFRIDRLSDGTAFSQIATVPTNVSTYDDASPGTSKFVYYRVRAFNAAGNSAYTVVLKVRNN